MDNPFDDDDAQFLVLINEQEQRSLWPDGHSIPEGWEVEHGPESREDCLSHVEDVWTSI